MEDFLEMIAEIVSNILETVVGKRTLSPKTRIIILSALCGVVIVLFEVLAFTVQLLPVQIFCGIIAAGFAAYFVYQLISILNESKPSAGKKNVKFSNEKQSEDFTQIHTSSSRFNRH